MTNDPTRLALELARTQRTMTLATADPEPWSAPVYFLYLHRRFYFFSSPDSRHVTAALASGTCAAAIFRDSDDWRDIEGLQMSGQLELIRRAAAGTAFPRYVQKFPTVKDFFADTVFDFGQFRERFHAQFYAFVPGQVCYLNNRAGLGRRQPIELPE